VSEGTDCGVFAPQVLNNAEINSLLPQMPALATFTKSLYECNYAEFFGSLGKRAPTGGDKSTCLT
jgi:hypothetical protein